jgi:hypothetical protein
MVAVRKTAPAVNTVTPMNASKKIFACRHGECPAQKEVVHAFLAASAWEVLVAGVADGLVAEMLAVLAVEQDLVG